MHFLNHLGIFGDRNTNVTLIGHNWGFLLGATLIKGNKSMYIISRILFIEIVYKVWTKNFWILIHIPYLDYPNLFDRIVILNVNNLPDGELDLERFHGNVRLFSKYLIFDAYFLAFRSSISLFRKYTPPRLLIKVIQNILQCRYGCVIPLYNTFIQSVNILIYNLPGVRKWSI